jgi:hypothetical protein
LVISKSLVLKGKNKKILFFTIFRDSQCAFVDYFDVDACLDAYSCLQGKNVNGCVLKIDLGKVNYFFQKKFVKFFIRNRFIIRNLQH